MQKKIYQKYIKKAQFWAHILGKMPGVSAIFLSGSLAQGRANKHSDIDIFIISKPYKIWTSRFFINSILTFCGKLAKAENHDGQICPNHFISENSLEIKEKDKYSANLFSHNIPLYDPKNIFENFKKKNKWVEDFGEKFSDNNAPQPPLNSRGGDREIFSKKNYLEKFLENIQRKKILRNKKNLDKKAKIILTDEELRFHPDPKNQYFKK